MSAWERFVHADVRTSLFRWRDSTGSSRLSIRSWTAMGHAGRLLFSLYLVDKKLLSSPNFYISAYLEPAARNTTTGYWLSAETVTGPVGACSFSPPSSSRLALVRQSQSYSKPLSGKKEASYHGPDGYAVHGLGFTLDRPVLKAPDFYPTRRYP